MSQDETGSVRPLLEMIARLRAPGGCPWDQQQGLADLRAYLLEEAHEVAATIDREAWTELRSELGDLLFQICFVAVLADEGEHFDFDQVVTEVHGKMIERHPHVFGETAGEELTAEQVARQWQRLKSSEGSGTDSLLEGIPASLPALTAAYRLGQKAAGVGFDWEKPEDVLAKVDEELAELRVEITRGSGVPERDHRQEEELGDLLFALTSLARHLGIDPERALARSNRKFKRRFREVGRELDREAAPDETPASRRDRLEAAWERAKTEPGPGSID